MAMTRVLSTTLAAAMAALLLGAPARAEDAHGGPVPPRVNWSFAGMFGRFDEAQLQRGFQVYKEVCSACHSMKLVSFRNLAQEGGPHFSASQVKALAASYQVKDGPNDSGDMFDRQTEENPLFSQHAAPEPTNDLSARHNQFLDGLLKPAAPELEKLGVNTVINLYSGAGLALAVEAQEDLEHPES